MMFDTSFQNLLKSIKLLLVDHMVTLVYAFYYLIQIIKFVFGLGSICDIMGML